MCGDGERERSGGCVVRPGRKLALVTCPVCKAERLVKLKGTESSVIRCRPCGAQNLSRSMFGYGLDDAVVLRLMAGDPPDGYSAAERRAAVRVLTQRGKTLPEIAKLLRVHQRTVERDREANRANLPAAG